MTHDYEVTHNEDGTFSISLPDGDELRIVLPKKEWVGLTVDEVFECWKTGDVVAAVETKLKEKNDG